MLSLSIFFAFSSLTFPLTYEIIESHVSSSPLHRCSNVGRTSCSGSKVSVSDVTADVLTLFPDLTLVSDVADAESSNSISPTGDDVSIKSLRPSFRCHTASHARGS